MSAPLLPADPAGMTNRDYTAARLGTRQWCVASRLTNRLAARGFELAVTSATLRQLESEWAEANPEQARHYHRAGPALYGLRAVYLSDAELAEIGRALRGEQPTDVGRTMSALEAITAAAEAPAPDLATFK